MLEKGIENLNIYLGVSEIEEGFKPQSFDALSTIKLEVPKKYTELSYFKKEQMSSDDDIDALTAEKREELFGTVTGKLHGQDFKPNMIKFKKNGEFIISQGKIGSMWGDSVVQIWITSLKESIQYKNVELKELHMKGIEMGVKENSQSSWAKTEFYKDCDYIIKFGKIEGKYLHGKIDIKFNDKDNSYVKGNFKSLIVEH